MLASGREAEEDPSRLRYTGAGVQGPSVRALPGADREKTGEAVTLMALGTCMMARTAKAAFYVMAGPLMKLNGALYRWMRAPQTGTVRVHLGPGQGKYLPGWINVDANAFTGTCDVWADLRNKLPFPDGSVDAFYSHHVIEHLPDLSFHFRELYRCLKPGGVFRVGGPNGDMAIRNFIDGESEWFGDFPEKRRSLGGRLDNFVYCRHEHLALLTFSYLEELADDAGFEGIRLCSPAKDTGFPSSFDGTVLGTESEKTPECPHTLVVEAAKPRPAPASARKPES